MRGAFARALFPSDVVDERSCETRCEFGGPSGTYSIDVGAPGFQTVHVAAVARYQSDVACCPSFVPVDLTVALEREAPVTTP